MGIKSFSKFLEENTPSAMKAITLDDLHGAKIVIDIRNRLQMAIRHSKVGFIFLTIIIKVKTLTGYFH